MDSTSGGMYHWRAAGFAEVEVIASAYDPQRFMTTTTISAQQAEAAGWGSYRFLLIQSPGTSFTPLLSLERKYLYASSAHAGQPDGRKYKQ